MSEELSRWYRGRLVVGPFRSFDLREVERPEREIGLPLPPSYRSFLEAAGGEGLPYSVRVPACAPEPLQGLGDLFRLGVDDDGAYGWGTLRGEYRRSREGWLAREVSLAGLLPIARNGVSRCRKPGEYPYSCAGVRHRRMLAACGGQTVGGHRW